MIASLFALYYFDAVQLEISPFLMNTLKALIGLLWLLSAYQYGMFTKLGIKGGLGRTITQLNRYITSIPEIQIRSGLKANEYQDLLKALFYAPRFLANVIACMVAFILISVLTIAPAMNSLQGPNSLLSAVTAGCIALFTTYCFTIVIAEIFTGEMRTRCLREMHDKKISIPQEINKSITTVQTKLFFFLGLFIVALFLSNILTYYNQKNLNRVWSFSLLAILVCLFMAYLISHIIYTSLKQIEGAAYDLMTGQKGALFLKSLDREFINVGKGINSASATIRDYQQELENKVEERTKALNETVEELNGMVKKLAEKDQLLETELEFAANIQKGIIPAHLETWNGISFASFYRPMGKVSGDYYDLFHFQGHIFVLLADASGHGVPAALITMAAKQAFATAMSEQASPKEVFTKVNDLLVEKIKTSDYLTAFLLKINEKNEITFSNASHPKAIHYIQARNEYILLDTNGMFIGAIPEANDFYEDANTKLQSGDRLYLYTDGVIEHKNARGEEYGLDRFIETLGNTKDYPIKEQISSTSQKVLEFIGGADIKDDISIFALELESNWGKFIAVYNNGLQFLKNSKFGEALQNFLEAQNLIPEFTGLYYQLALVKYQMQEYQEAEGLIQLYRQKKPNDSNAIKIHINILAKLQKKQEARKLLAKLHDIES
ncbi:MAG: SpoIIE family protein phosphatase [Spirochaetota bacterium]